MSVITQSDGAFFTLRDVSLTSKHHRYTPNQASIMPAWFSVIPSNFTAAFAPLPFAAWQNIEDKASRQVRSVLAERPLLATLPPYQ
jgi:hypothetical protein